MTRKAASMIGRIFPDINTKIETLSEDQNQNNEEIK